MILLLEKTKGSRLKELKLLMHRRGTLNLSKLENANYVDDAKAVQLNDEESQGLISSMDKQY